MDVAISWSCCSTFFVEGNADTWGKTIKMETIFTRHCGDPISLSMYRLALRHILNVKCGCGLHFGTDLVLVINKK